MAAFHASRERVLTECRRDRGRLERRERHRQGAGLENQCQVLRLARVTDAGDLGAVRAADPVRVLIPVDRRPGFDLAVEDDRKVLRDLLAAAEGREPPAPLGFLARDRTELVRTLVGELHQHDRLTGVRVEVCARARELEVSAAHFGHHLVRVGVRGVEADQIEGILGRVDRVDAGADDLADAARKDDRLRRHPEDLPPLRERALRTRLLDHLALQQLVLGGDGPAAQLLLVVEEVPRRLAVLVHESLLTGEERVQRVLCDREALRAGRRGDEVGLEVEELELRGLPQNPDHLLLVLEARQVDHDLVFALLADLGLRDAEPVDAIAQDLDRAVEIGLLQRPVGRRHRLQSHLEAALEVEPEGRRLLDRRSGNGKQPDADKSGGDECDEGEVRSAIHGSSGVG